MYKVTSFAPADFIWPAHSGLVLKQGVNLFPDLPDELVKRFRIMQDDGQVRFESTEKLPVDEKFGLPAVDASVIESGDKPQASQNQGQPKR